ncbi:hypothetical protein [Salinarimonas soli]|uniref:Uncharacterized protein n=1 Tax=Salinarimonas soli TaxID=1638099 RepID=A0A5B2VQ16_9HYPH|nr:hypothetical protein [Salinarimonas soli]KAA2241125.1 hypothetical protein F0L46_04830 [Salinarimonas soli]
MIADPTLIELMKHLAWTPPAIVREAGDMNFASEAASYERQIAESEKELQIWIDTGRRIRESLWNMGFESSDRASTVEFLTSLIDTFEKGRKAEFRLLERLQKRMRRVEKTFPPALRPRVKAQHDRMFSIGRRFYEEGLDYAAFLRAARAEFDPASRSGPTFDNPDDLERYLTQAIA